MLRRTFLQAAGLGALPLAAPAQQSKRNVVLILADDLGWSDLGVYGADLHETPHLDALAKESVRFTQAMTASPVCSPTRASIMTGKHPARLHITIWLEGAKKPVANRRLLPAEAIWNLPHSEVTLAERFGGAGYRTASVGKWHLGEAEHYPETQGFGTNIGGTLWGAPATFFAPFAGNHRFGGEHRYVPHLEEPKPGEYLTDRLTDEALRWLDKGAGKPFFLYLAHHSPHTPIEAPADRVAYYKEKLKPGMHHQNATYAAMVESLDKSVGRVMEAVKKAGQWDNTVFVFLSDNGGFIGKFDGQVVTNNHPLRSGKGSLYEGGLRVPLLIHAPGVKPGVCNEPVYSCDLHATLVELAGGTVAAPEDGRSLLPLLRDPQSRLDRDTLYFHYPHYYETTTPVSCVRERDWKLLHYFEDGRRELYHLAEDPYEQRDLAASQPERVRAMAAKLEAWWKQVGAQAPRPNPAFRG
ncbi:MAG: sulfatase [Bryobacterales bacterium]|nr:sulfatase [Bryobacterales bacterium]